MRMFVHREGKALSETGFYQVFPSQMRALLAEHA